MDAMTPESTAKTSALASPWVWGFIGLISVALMVNMTMAYLAVSTSPGLVAKDYYERGKSFEKRATLQSATLDRLQWKLSLSAPEKITAGEKVTFNLTAQGADGLPAKAATARLFAYRPSDAKADFSSPMTHVEGSGYVADAVFPLKGVWDIIVTVSDGDGHADVIRRISVAAPATSR
ncbi:MAG: FixH family protein [Nitrospinae bacterium]|nr:FixH family protein [Nitrospinota bacterium]